MKKLRGQGGGGGEGEEGDTSSTMGDTHLTEEEGGGGCRCCDLEMGKLKSDEETSLHEEEESLLMEGERSCRGQGDYLGHSSLEVPKVIVSSSRNINRASSERDTPARLATPDHDIQLAEPKRQVSLRSLGGGGLEQLGLGSVCGPSPAKITKICIVVLSIWVSWIFLIHLSRRAGELADRLDESEQSLRSLERDSQAFRSQSEARLARLQEELQQLKHNQNRQGAKRILKKKTSSSNNSNTNHLAFLQPGVPTPHPTPVPTISGSTTDDLFDADWLENWDRK